MIYKAGKCVANYKGSPTSSQNDMNFGPQTVQTGSEFSPTLCKFCIPLHGQASLTEITKQSSTKLFQMVHDSPH